MLDKKINTKTDKNIFDLKYKNKHIINMFLT